MTEELKDAEFSDLEDTLFKKELTYSEIEKNLIRNILSHHLQNILYQLVYITNY